MLKIVLECGKMGILNVVGGIEIGISISRNRRGHTRQVA